ncbi:GGDEF domain-containing protein [Treponema sp.]|uniref:GGDEF domain-containing protein n=1 Tax=Treponema sp. TaxID=166 RepID=UPI0025F706AD|nr:GGDEF domain-containing protein [Treponema sp.]MCR5219220.1 GGDEF domain-containing protein [Treponema sp.]
MGALVDWATKEKNKLFMLLCLSVHVFYVGVFAILQCWIPSFINMMSAIIYIWLAFIKRPVTEGSIVIAYIEINIFSVACSLFTGGAFGFLFFVVGTFSIIFYLTPSFKKVHLLFHLIGLASCIAIVTLWWYKIFLIPELFNKLIGYSFYFSILNLCFISLAIFITSYFFMRDLRKTRERLDYNVNHDLLTGLYNRRYAEEYIASHNINFAIGMLDIDDFKQINDMYGHHMGDMVLKTVSNIFTGSLNSQQFAVRWGGEEFILLFPEYTVSQAQKEIRDICHKISQTQIEDDGVRVSVRLTAGVCDGSSRTFEAAVRNADNLLYYGKRHGKNRVIAT